MSKVKRIKHIDAFMSEKILFGGIVVTRARALAYMQQRDYCGARSAIDWFVYRPDALMDDTPEWDGPIPDDGLTGDESEATQ